MTLSKFFASFAAAGLLSTAAMAQTQMDPDTMIRAEDITDGDLYRYDVSVDDAEWASGATFTQVSADWTKVGDIDDILMDKDGKIVGLLVEIGGFLGIADKDVVIPLESVRFSSGGKDAYHFVTNMSEAELEALPEVDDDIWD